MKPVPDNILLAIARGDTLGGVPVLRDPNSPGVVCLIGVGWRTERADLARELLAAREALRYYADEANYSHEQDEEGYDYPSLVDDDGGHRARARLPEYDK